MFTLCTAYHIQYKLNRPGHFPEPGHRSDSGHSPHGTVSYDYGSVGFFYPSTESKCHRVILSSYFGGNCYGK